MNQNDNKQYAPKWVGIIGFILVFFCAPLDAEGPEFVRNFFKYCLSILPIGLFLIWASGGFHDFINDLKEK